MRERGYEMMCSIITDCAVHLQEIELSNSILMQIITFTGIMLGAAPHRSVIISRRYNLQFYDIYMTW